MLHPARRASFLMVIPVGGMLYTLETLSVYLDFRVLAEANRRRCTYLPALYARLERRMAAIWPRRSFGVMWRGAYLAGILPRIYS